MSPVSLFYDPSEALVDFLDKVDISTRKVLLDDARPEFPPIVKVEKLDGKTKGHTLADEWDHRQLEVECNGGFSEIDRLRPLHRQLIEDSGLHADIVDGRIVKIVKKRDAEFLQGEEREFGFTEDGQRVPISDDVLDQGDEVLVSVDSEFMPPRDKWDLIFDATPLIQRVHMMRERLSELDKNERINLLERMADNLVYSAKYFPAKKFNQNQSTMRADVLHLRKLISNGVISRASLFAFCNPPEKKTRREARNLFLQGKRMKLGKDRAQALFLAGQKMERFFEEGKKNGTIPARYLEKEEACLIAAKQELATLPKENEEDRPYLIQEITSTQKRINKWRKELNRRAFEGTGDYTSEFSIGEKRDLWEALTLFHVEKNGEALLSERRFKRLYHGILCRRYLPAVMKKLDARVEKKEITEKEMKAQLKKFQTAAWKRVHNLAKEIYSRERMLTNG